jgi:hypothetical protein
MTYARFSVDTSAFQVHEMHVGVGYSAFAHFLRFWREYGVFVALNRDFLPLRQILPDDLRKKFDAVAKHMQHHANRVEYSSIDIGAVLSDIANGTFENLDRANLRVIGILDDLYAALSPNKGNPSFPLRRAREEICRIRDLMLTETKSQLDELRATDVAPEVPAQQVWEDKLRPLFEANYLISVVDPYALLNLFKEPDPLHSGLGFLLAAVTREQGRIGAVEIHTSLRDVKKPDEAIGKLAAFCNVINAKSVDIFIADRTIAQQLMHDRFFIGTDHTIDVGRGLDLLSAAPRRQPISFAFKPMTRDRSHNYLLLRNARRGMRALNF